MFKKPYFNYFNKKHNLIDLMGLLFLGLLSLVYVIFVKSFAELHLQFRFLDFPIFAGEISLFICLVLFFLKYRDNPQNFTRWHYLIILYFAFVIVKALDGYMNWGALAFRHAALLYYPAFAVFAYVFYRRDFFDEKVRLFLWVVISAVLLGEHSDYCVLTLVTLGFILIASCSYKTLKFFMLLIFLFIIPYKEFFLKARTMIVSNFLAGLYFATVFPLLFLGNKKKIKFILVVVMVGTVIVGTWKFADRGAVKSIYAFKEMVQVIKECDNYINANASNFKMAERKEIKLYNPDRLSNTAESVVGDNKLFDVVTVDNVKSELQTAFKEDFKRTVYAIPPRRVDSGWSGNYNAVFRLLIWRDMLVDLSRDKPFLGFDFGKPFRSKSLEILNWGSGDWERDGWIEAHNSYLNIVYRTGFVGIVLIFILIIILFTMIAGFIKARSFTGICLCGIIINWFVAANFLLIFELPYTAIPVWTVYGMTLAYYHNITPKNYNDLVLQEGNHSRESNALA